MTDREPDVDAADDEEPGTGRADADDLDLEAVAEADADASADDAGDLEDTIVDVPASGPGRASAGTTGRATRDLDRGPRRPAPTARSSAPAPTPSDAAVHVDDRVSKLFVMASVIVFLVILANAVFFGQGGFLSPTPTPSPSATLRPSASASPSATGSTSPSPSGSAAPSASGSAAPSAPSSPSASPSVSPSASASPSG